MNEPLGYEQGPGGARAYDVGAVREMLLAAFSPASLVRFCLDYPLFQPVVAEFAPSDGLSAMADKLVAYCLRMSLFDELVASAREVNPRQVERFEPQLARPGLSPTTSSPDAVLARAQELLALGQEDEAIRLLRQAYRAHPHYQEIEQQLLAALYEKGSRDHVRGRHGEALTALQQAAEIDPFYESLPWLMEEVRRAHVRHVPATAVSVPAREALPARRKSLLTPILLVVVVVVLLALAVFAAGSMLGWW